MSGAMGIFGTTFPCECGRTHAVRPERVIYGSAAMERLGALCAAYAPGGRCAVLMDARTAPAAGDQAAEALAAAGLNVRRLLVEDTAPGIGPVCDEPTRARLAGRAGDADLFVPVGAGVLSDLGKWLAFEAGVPCVTYATAASMNGYASANVAPSVGGVKTLLRARPPAAVLADPAVLAAAPYELTTAGLGDVLAKGVSSADWLLNHRLFGDYYCRRSVGLIAEIEPLYLARPEALKAREPGAMRALFEALLLTGAAMTMAETSAPASGAEHLVSHSLDMLAWRDGRGHDLHGRQVGVGTILAAELYRRVLAVESPDWRPAPADVDRAYWGRLADAVARRYAEKVPRLRQAVERLGRGGAWDALRADLAQATPAPHAVRDCLAAAGAACRAGQIGCGADRLRGAFAHAHQMRPRFTVLDLANLLGLMPAAAGEIVEQWAA